MHRLMSMLVIAGSLGFAGLTMASAAPIGLNSVETDGSGVQLAQSGGYCARLRRACMFKEERGQAGEGNCRRYRRVWRTRKLL